MSLSVTLEYSYTVVKVFTDIKSNLLFLSHLYKDKRPEEITFLNHIEFPMVLGRDEDVADSLLFYLYDGNDEYYRIFHGSRHIFLGFCFYNKKSLSSAHDLNC